MTATSGTMKHSPRMDAIQAPIVAIVGDWIRRTPGTISLGQGVVHYGPPPAALAAVAAAAQQATTHQYQDASGQPALLAEIEGKLRRDNAIDVRRGSRIMVTAGGNMAFIHAVLAVTEPGDEVILPAPFYFNHEMAVQMFGCRAVPVPTDSDYQLDVDAVRAAITGRTRAVVTVSPNNPTGVVFHERALRELNSLCRERGLYHISDEAYEYFTYGEARHVSPGSFDGAQQHTLSLYSLSKTYGMAGWRIGYMVYPERLASAMAKIQDTILICPPVMSQVLAAAAMADGPAYCRQHIETLDEVRGVVFAALQSLEPLCSVPPADGAFYCCLRVNRSADAMRVTERLIRDYKVAVIPGTAFGLTDGCYFRVAYGALEKATVAEGIGRLVTGLRAILTSG
jgi:aspartate/methionine/tyrosine aminotransferase